MLLQMHQRIRQHIAIHNRKLCLASSQAQVGRDQIANSAAPVHRFEQSLARAGVQAGHPQCK